MAVKKLDFKYKYLIAAIILIVIVGLVFIFSGITDITGMAVQEDVPGIGDKVDYAALKSVGISGGVVKNNLGTAKLNIPSGALDNEVMIEVNPVIEVDPASYSSLKGLAPVGYLYEFGPDGQTFDEPVEIILTYDDANVADETKLKVLYYDENSLSWTEIDAVQDTDANTFTFTTTHFSMYGTFGPVTMLGTFSAADSIVSFFCFIKGDDDQIITEAYEDTSLTQNDGTGSWSVVTDDFDSIDINDQFDIVFSDTVDRAQDTDIIPFFPPTKDMGDTAITTATPDVPTGFSAAGGDGVVELSWNTVGELTYNLYRSETGDGMYDRIASGISAGSYNDTDVVNDQTYYYVLVAKDGSNVLSGHTDEVNAAPATIGLESDMIIWDEPDEGLIKYANDDVYFFANYTYGSAAIKGASCIINFEDSLNNEMEYKEKRFGAWNKLHDGGYFDEARGVAVDSNNNIIVTGTSDSGAGENNAGFDYYTIKYDPDGNHIWNKTADFSSVKYGGDNARAAAVDSDNNIVIVGYSSLNHGTCNSEDYVTIKYDSSGNHLWNKTYSSNVSDYQCGKYDYAHDAAIDSNNNIIVTGYSYGYLPSRHYHYNAYTIKYDPNGNELWNKEYYRGRLPKITEAYGTAVDSNDDVIITGIISSSEFAAPSCYIIKYENSTGNQVWIKTFNTGASDYAYDAAVDSNDNIIAVGKSDINGNDDFLIIKYNSTGSLLWNVSYGCGKGTAKKITVDTDNNIIAAGYCDINGRNYYTIKYDSEGNRLWSKEYDSGDIDHAQGIAVDSNNNIIVTGDADFNYYTIKYGYYDIYQYNRSYASAGTYDWNVTCSKDGYETLTKNDTVLINATPTPAIRYAATTGSDTDNDCLSQGSPCQTIQHAINVSNSVVADTVSVAAGTYHEQIVIDKELILQGVDRGTTVIDGSNNNGTIIWVKASNVSIINFTIRNINQHIEKGEGMIAGNIYLDGLNNARNCNIIENNITDGYMGIFLDSSSNNNIFNNIIEDNVITVQADYLMTVGCGIKSISYTDNPGSHNTISNNIIRRNGIQGITLEGDYDNITNNIIEANVAELVPFIAIGWGLTLSNNGYVFNNTITGHKTPPTAFMGICHGIMLSRRSNNIIVGNNISDNSNGMELSGRCAACGLPGDLGAKNNKIINNTISNNENSGIDINNIASDQPNDITGNNITDNTWGIKMSFASGGNYIKIKYNNFQGHTGQDMYGQTKYAVYDTGTMWGGVTHYATYNYWGCADGPRNENGNESCDGLGHPTWNGKTPVYTPWLCEPYPMNDSDEDWLGASCDNCPNDFNPDQLESDDENGGDVCDVCPAANDTSCTTKGADTVDAGTTTIISTDDGNASVEIPSSILDDDVTVSITGFDPVSSPDLGFGISNGTESGSDVYIFKSSDTSFDGNVTIIIYYDPSIVTNPSSFDIYWWNNQSQSWEAQQGECGVGGDYCNLTVNHFSLFILLEDDEDGIPTYYDNCPIVYNPDQTDSDATLMKTGTARYAIDNDEDDIICSNSFSQGDPDFNNKDLKWKSGQYQSYIFKILHYAQDSHCLTLEDFDVTSLEYDQVVNGWNFEIYEPGDGAGDACDCDDGFCDGREHEFCCEQGIPDLTCPECPVLCTDNDEDGYDACENGNPVSGCSDPCDCDDSDPIVYPGADDSNCNSIDEDCDGISDDGYIPTITYCGASECYANGIYDPNITGCDGDLCYSEGALDCINGTLVDTCASLPPTTVYYDNDLDEYGDPYTTQNVCIIPDGYIFVDEDCDDTNAAINPRADDICDINHNVIDMDCDASNDYLLDCVDYCGDVDEDGYVTDEKWDDWGGVIPDLICPWIKDKGDCNDYDAAINPEAVDVCDGVDNDCDGKIDEGCPAVDKEDALTILESLSSSDSESQKELDNAVKELTKSLGNRIDGGDKKIVWLDTVHIACRHGHKTFDKEKKAVDHLEKITDAEIISDVSQVINLIVNADRNLALTTINEAPEGEDKDKAIEKFDEGEAETRNKHKIQEYRKAWKYINKHCEKDDKKKSCVEEINVQSPMGDIVTAVGDEVGHPNTVFTDIYENKIAIHTSCSKCIYEGQVIEDKNHNGWTIIEIVDDGSLAVKCG